MTPGPRPASGQRLGYRADLAETAADAPGPPDVSQLFADRLDTIHSPRPALRELLNHARPGDTVVVASMEQLARSLADLSRVVKDLTARGAAVEFVQEQLTFGLSPAPGPTAADVLDALADFDHARYRDRQRAGIEAAKTKGVYKGRAKKLDPEQVRQLLDQAAAGTSKTHLARHFRISRETVYQYLRRGNQPNRTTAN